MSVIDLVGPARTATGPDLGRGWLRGYRPDIEALRALAVVLVVLYHAGVPFLQGGYVGVDVFFVISGYLITRHLHTELTTHGRIRLTDFYARRIRRLLPLATLVTLATLAATWLIASPLQARRTATDALWSTLFAMNIHLANSGVDYQANQDPSPLQHYWSLAIEEQFYLVWPLLITAASLLWLRRRHTPHGTRPTPSTTLLLTTITLATAASLAYAIHTTDIARSLAYFATPARAWELGIGGLLAIAAPTLARTRLLAHTPTTTLLAVTGLTAITTSAILYTDTTPFPGTAALLPVLGTAATLTAGLHRPTPLETHLLDTPLPQGLGRISYGLYLWHWPLLTLAPTYLDTTPTPLQTTLTLTLALWLSVVSYAVVESPVREVARLRLPARRTVAAGLAALAVTSVGVVGSTALVPDARGTGRAAASLTDGLTALDSVASGAQVVEVPSNLTPALDTAADDDPTRGLPAAAHCHTNLLPTTLSDDGSPCVFGDPRADTTVVLAGDSHAYQWLPTLDLLARQQHWRVVSMTKSGCPLYDVALENQTLRRDYRECYTWRERVLARITAEDADLVVTTGAVFSSRGDDFAAAWADGVDTTVTGLRARGREVVVLEDTPYPGRDVPECLAAHLDRATACTVPVEEALSDPVRRASTRERAAAAGAVVVDPVPWFCTPTRCAVVVGDTLVYRDNSHLTATYARALAPQLAAALPAPFGPGRTS
ncbi:acyltransferase family protein [Arthrobacter sp. NEB 688]|uniref:acyltransferase family protein n=1 Tax=Arthrobacter sp. NEB 688 TaxID=904039 RepID=UPI00156603C5|nr:acyltransferase family protein [Arthrobacter sp. NEB 688]QKE83635.1 acyltransferase [Arthrobacter sp. NEB 688]